MSKYVKVSDVKQTLLEMSKEKTRPVGWGDVLMERLKDLSIEVSEDCISREDAIKAYNEAIDELVKAEMEEFNLGDFTECSFNTTQINLIARKIENAPSVVPTGRKNRQVERAEGEWVLSERQSQADNDNGNYAYVCTNCNHTDIHAKTQKVPYCWWCGAKMKGAEE